jgi:hypothetical protein
MISDSSSIIPFHSPGWRTQQVTTPPNSALWLRLRDRKRNRWGRWLPEDVAPDAELVAVLLNIPEAEALQLLEELEAAGYLVSAVGPVQ